MKTIKNKTHKLGEENSYSFRLVINPMKKLLFLFVGIFTLTANAQNYVWAKNMGGRYTDDGYSIATDASGNVYVTGSFLGTADFDPSANTANLTSAGSTDIFIAKYNASGNYVWAKRIGGSLLDDGYSIATDASGNVYVTGRFYGTVDFAPSANIANLTSAGLSDIFIAKYNTSGNYVWAKRIGGSSGEAGYSIAVDVSGNVYVTGFFSGTADFDPSANVANLTSAGEEDIFIAKYNASGNYVWAKRMGGADSDYRQYKNSITIDASGNVYVTGVFRGTADFDPSADTANLISAGEDDIFIAKYNASGNYVWAKRIGSSGNDVGSSIATDASGNVYITGNFRGTVDFNPSADTANLIAAGSDDIFIAKYDASGNYIWAKNMGGASYDEGNSIATDASGNVYITGRFSGIADFDPSADTVNLSAGYEDVFIAKYDASGNYVWAKNMGGVVTTPDCGNSITIDNSDNVYVTGVFWGTGDFDPSVNTANLTSAGNHDIFIAKYRQCESTSSTHTISACVSFNFNGELLTQSGTYYYTLTNSKNCDSIITLNLTIKQPTSSTQNIFICTGESYVFNGKTFTTDTIYYDTLINSQGCDSIITLNLIVNQPTSNTITASACSSYVFNGKIFTTDTIYYDTLINAQGCDSIITLNLTIKQPTSNTIVDSACGFYIFNGKTFTTDTIYYDTLTNSQGCDSIITLNLTIYPLPVPVVSTNGDTLSTTAFTTYQWLRNDTAIGGATSQIYIRQQTVFGHFKVFVTDNNGCGNTSDTVSFLNTGIHDISKMLFSIYPNPSKGELNITAQAGATVHVLSLHGQEIYKGTMEKETLTLNFKLIEGLYFVRLTNANGESVVKKIVFE